MVSFGNFARIARLYVGFRLVTLYGYFFSLRLFGKVEFLARTSNKTCLQQLIDKFTTVFPNLSAAAFILFWDF